MMRERAPSVAFRRIPVGGGSVFISGAPVRMADLDSVMERYSLRYLTIQEAKKYRIGHPLIVALLRGNISTSDSRGNFISEVRMPNSREKYATVVGFMPYEPEVNKLRPKR